MGTTITSPAKEDWFTQSESVPVRSAANKDGRSEFTAMNRNTIVTVLLVIAAASAGNRPLHSWFDMERPNSPKTLHLEQG